MTKDETVVAGCAGSGGRTDNRKGYSINELSPLDTHKVVCGVVHDGECVVSS